jgi:hypothetical protein
MSEQEKAKKAPILLTETETDHVAGGAPTGDPGNAYGAAHGFGFDDHGSGKGQGWFRNDQSGNARF